MGYFSDSLSSSNSAFPELNTRWTLNPHINHGSLQAALKICPHLAMRPPAFGYINTMLLPILQTSRASVRPSVLATTRPKGSAITPGVLDVSPQPQLPCKLFSASAEDSYRQAIFKTADLSTPQGLRKTTSVE